MPLTLSPTCEHDISEQDSACQADGLCPLCLAAALEAKDAEMMELTGKYDAALDEIIKQADAKRDAIRAADAEIASLKEDARASSALAAENFARAKKTEAEIKELRAALDIVRGIIVEGAMEGFNPLVGDWAERLFASQALTHAALEQRATEDKK